MLNLAALDSPVALQLSALDDEMPPASAGGFAFDVDVTVSGFTYRDQVAYDLDGRPVPPQWVAPGWYKITERMRAERSSEYAARLAAVAPKPERQPRAYAPTFTTDYAIKWGRRQGWKLIERERYDWKLKRHHDLELGMDAMFDDGNTGRVGLQGAGRSERAEHYRRFWERGGVEKAQRRAVRVVYVEFVREDREPKLVEWWA